MEQILEYSSEGKLLLEECSKSIIPQVKLHIENCIKMKIVKVGI